MIGTRIQVCDLHMVVTPNGAVVPTLCSFMVTPRATQSVLKVDGRAALVKGNSVRNRQRHVPIGGTFQIQPANEGRFVTPGQGILRVDGKPVVVEQGMMETCDDVQRTKPVKWAARTPPHALRVDGFVTLLGER